MVWYGTKFWNGKQSGIVYSVLSKVIFNKYYKKLLKNAYSV